MGKLSTEDFISRAKKVHKDIYDYSEVVYKDIHTKVKIICVIHGKFEQAVYGHLQGKGCLKCGRVKSAKARLTTTKNFLERAFKKHGYRYDYSKTVYKNSYTKVGIICPEHGEFRQIPGDHLSGRGCRVCGIRKRTKSRTTKVEDFILKAKKIHSDIYDYSKVDYKSSHVKIKIICPKHKVFEQIPTSHLQGRGCRKCANEELSINKMYTTRDFVKKAKKVHKGRYEYHKVDYKSSDNKVKITCLKHGSFYQDPSNHLSGDGCPKCAPSGFDKTKPAIFYYLKYEDLYKVGITNRTIKKRYGAQKMKDITVLFEEGSKKVKKPTTRKKK